MFLDVAYSTIIFTYHPIYGLITLMKILAIETSCDETAAAVVEKNGNIVRILSNIVASQIDLHKKFGGVFPEIASRAHSEKRQLAI